MVNEEGHTSQPPARRPLVLITLGALAVATVAAVLFVLPAEYGIDPTGVGAATGVSKLAATQPAPARTLAVETGDDPAVPAPADLPPEAVLAPASATRYYDTAYRTNSIDIPLKAKGDANGDNGVEYKFYMKKGQTIVYSWETTDLTDKDELFYDFHAEQQPLPAGHPKNEYIEYRNEAALQGHGSLTVPVDGIHGWYFENRASKPIIVRLKVSGFYDLIPPGESGNMARLQPNPL